MGKPSDLSLSNVLIMKPWDYEPWHFKKPRQIPNGSITPYDSPFMRMISDPNFVLDEEEVDGEAHD